MVIAIIVVVFILPLSWARLTEKTIFQNKSALTEETSLLKKSLQRKNFPNKYSLRFKKI